MMKEYSLIKNGVVENIIVANDEFVAKLATTYDEIVPVDNLNRPSVGWIRSQGQFQNPKKAEEDAINQAWSKIADARTRLSALDLQTKINQANTIAQIKSLLLEVLPDLISAAK